MLGIDDHRGVLKARESFLVNGHLDDTAKVRSEILASWRRSRSCAVDPQQSSPGLVTSASDNSMVEIAAPIIDHAFRTVGSDVATLILTNAAGVIQRRWSGSGWFPQSVTPHFAELGVSLSEASVGANAVGIVQEIGRSTIVSGAEHYSDSFLPVSCAGAPITHPITSKLIGILDVTCCVTESSAMLLPWVTALAKDVERALLERSSRAERMLLDEYIRASRLPGKSPIICLNDRTIIATPAAARMVDGVSQVLLWECVREVVSRSNGEEFVLSVEDREPVTVWCRPIVDGDSTVGAFVRFTDNASSAPATRPKPTSDGGRHIGFLSGQSAAWKSMCEEVTLAKDLDVPLVLRGGPGAGKFALAESIYPDDENIVLDAEEAYDDVARWLGTLQRTLDSDPVRVVIIRHLDALQPRHRRTVAGIIERFAAKSTKKILVTETAEPGDSGRPADAFSGYVVNVPTLNARREDLPHLLESLSESLTGRPRKWRPDAVQVIARADWPGNLRQLRNVVRSVLTAHPVGELGIKQLPGDLLANTPKRYLTRLERLELNEILSALKYFNGNKVEAAEYLEISRSTLYRRIRSFGLDLDRLAY